MANVIYQTAKTSFLNGANNLSSATIKLALVSASYTPNTGNGGDSWYSTISSYGVGTPVALTSVTTTNGTLNSAAVSYSVPANATAKYVVLYVDTGTAGTSQLLCVDDTATGLPFTAASTTTTVTITPNASGLFQL